MNIWYILDLFYDAFNCSEAGNDEIKNCFLEIGKDFGNVILEKIKWMVNL